MSTVLTHTGLLHDYPKSELRTVWETAAPKLNLSPTAIKYVRRLIELTSKQDYLPNSICAVFFGVAKLTQKIGMPRRSINHAESELAEAGWIVMSCPKRGRRNGVRAVDGCKQIKWAAGVNLGPLIDRFVELQELAAEVEMETLALQACRAEINATRRQIIDAGYVDEAVKAYVVGDTTYLVRICLEYICVGVMVGDEIIITDRRLDRYGTRLDNIVEDLIDICALPEIADELEFMTQFNRPRKSFYTEEMGEW